MKMFMIGCSARENNNILLKNRLFFAQSLVFLCLLINAFRPNTVPSFFLFALELVVPFFLKPVEIAAYIVCFSMMGTGIQVAYIAFSCIIAIMIKTKMKVKIITLVSILSFVFYELIHFAMSSSDSATEFLRYAIVFSFLFYIMFMRYDISEKLCIIDSYMYGTIFSLLHIFVETFRAFNGNLLNFVDGSFRFGYSEQLGVDLTMSADPNSVGQGCTIIIALSLMLILLGYKNKKYYVTTMIALIFGTLTISKTFLLSLAIIVVLTILFSGSWSSIRTFRKNVLLLLLIAIGCFIVIKINPTYIENILSRVDESDITTGRVANATIYLNYLSQNASGLLFGVGMQNVGEKIGFTGSPHAMLIETLICWGVVGSIAVILLIAFSIKYQIGNAKTRMINWVPLMVYTVIMQTTQLFRLRDRVFTILVIIVSVGISQKGEEERD